MNPIDRRTALKLTLAGAGSLALRPAALVVASPPSLRAVCSCCLLRTCKLLLGTVPGVLCAARDTRVPDRAAAGGGDRSVLGPMLPTRSHPGASTLGWARFEQTLADPLVPVMALGGLAQADRARAQSHGAQGVALMRGGWPVV